MKLNQYLHYILIATLLAGCASTGAVDTVNRDLDLTKSRMLSLEKEFNNVKESEKSLKNDFALLRKADADLHVVVDGVKSDMQILSAKLDDAVQTGRRPAEELNRYREDSDRRLVALEDRIVKLHAAVDELSKRLSDSMASGAAINSGEVKADALYLKGLESFKANDMAGARASLVQFLEKHSGHELTPNARYWIGETYYGEKNYEQAILEFQEVIKQYPKNEKASAAMLKQALSFRALKDIKSARYVLNRLVKEYPKSDDAKKARTVLKELK